MPHTQPDRPVDGRSPRARWAGAALTLLQKSGMKEAKGFGVMAVNAEALRIALSIPVTSAALAALNREMAQLQTHYPTGVCTAQGHLDAIAALNEQLAALTPAEVNSPVRMNTFMTWGKVARQWVCSWAKP